MSRHRTSTDEDGREGLTRSTLGRGSAHVADASAPAPLNVTSTDDLRRLQRAAGNRAVTSVVVQRYVPTPKHERELKAAITKAWGGPIAKAFKGSDSADAIAGFADDVAGMFDTHGEAIAYIRSTSYAVFEARDEAPKTKPKWTSAAAAAYAAAGADVATADPGELANIEAVLVALKTTPLPGYTLADLRDIDTRKRSLGQGWSTAIQGVAVAKADKAANAAAAAALTARYAAGKAAGDLVFAGGLVRAIWDASYSIATTPGITVNPTLGGEYGDATILAAVALWNGCGTLAAGTPGSVSHFHVPAGPGGQAPIQDKSKRAVNPDPTRGRQADFICTWGGTEINMHVNSNVHH